MSAIRVLIVDDHPMVRRGLKSLLSSYPDIEVIGDVGDGVAALEKATQLSPDIILLDIQMPELDGVEVAQRLRRVVPASKIIALTAFAMSEDRVKALAVGEMLPVVQVARGMTALMTKRPSSPNTDITTRCYLLPRRYLGAGTM